MRIHFNVDYNVDIPDCAMGSITAVFKKLLLLIFADFARLVLEQFAISFMNQTAKPFSCEKCGNSTNFIWKTKRAKDTKITTIFAEIKLPQMQVQCKKCGKKMYITRKLLGIGARQRMSETTKRILALVGSLTSFRVSEKLFALVGVKIDKMAVWRCVQKVGEQMEFGIDENAMGIGEADGTGVRIQGIKKRGRELKVFVQRKASGAVHVAGVSIGRYERDWDKLFEPLKESLKKFRNFLLITDGDTSILGALEGVKVLFQRCLWHMPYQMKYYLWKDGIKRESSEWYYILGKVFDITAIRYGVEDQGEIEAIIQTKNEHLDKLLTYLETQGHSSCLSYLKNAQGDLFTAFRNKLRGKTTSKAERVMRTVKLRTTMGKWSEKGALNAIKVRLAYYYNGFDPSKENIDNKTTVLKNAA